MGFLTVNGFSEEKSGNIPYYFPDAIFEDGG